MTFPKMTEVTSDRRIGHLVTVSETKALAQV